MESIVKIFTIFADVGGIAGLVILLLFMMLNRELRDLKRQNETIILNIEKSKDELNLQIEKTKACVLKIMYEFNMCQDRRRRDKPVKVERRETRL